MRKSKLNEECAEDVLGMYRAGNTIADIGYKYKCSKSTVRNYLLNHGVLMHKRGRGVGLTPDRIQYAVMVIREKYPKMPTYTELAKELGVCRQTICNYIRKNGITIV